MSSAVEPLSESDIDRLSSNLAAAQFVVLGGLAVVVGQGWATQAMTVQSRGEWFTMDISAGFFYGALLSAVGIAALSIAWGIHLKSRRVG